MRTPIDHIKILANDTERAFKAKPFDPAELDYRLTLLLATIKVTLKSEVVDI